MDIFPNAKVARFENLEPGEVFAFIDSSSSYLAMKIDKSKLDNDSSMVTIGPNFPDNTKGPAIYSWHPTDVVSYGKAYTVILTGAQNTWYDSEDLNQPGLLALGAEGLYLKADGNGSRLRTLWCNVELGTGNMSYGRLQGLSMYTNNWELIIPHSHLPPFRLLKYPLEDIK